MRANDLDVSIKVRTHHSERLLNEAWAHSPNGVQGAGRWYEPFPLFIKRALGARIWDVDDNEYIDYHAAYGPAVLGHNDARVREAVIDTLEHDGVVFGTPHARESELTRLFAELVPCAEKTIICGGGGSDAMYHAVRVARGYTGRTKLLKFEGGYHGWHDDLGASVRPRPEDAGPAEAPRTVGVSRGSLERTIREIVVAPLNDFAAVEAIVTRERDSLAAIVVEPVCHSAGCILPRDGFLALLRQLCDAYGIILIFDEIITGFRHHIGGAQAIFGVTPDLGVFGKAMTNGFPGSALAGKRDIMSMLAPEGPVFLSGTFMGHLVGVTAALATIEILRDGKVYEKLFRLGDAISAGINAAAERLKLDARCYNFGSVWCLYFTRKVESYRDIAPMTAFGKEYPRDQAFRRTLLNNGIYIQPNYINKAFVSAAHTDNDVDRTIGVTVNFLTEYQTHLR